MQDKRSKSSGLKEVQTFASQIESFAIEVNQFTRSRQKQLLVREKLIRRNVSRNEGVDQQLILNVPYVMAKHLTPKEHES